MLNDVYLSANNGLKTTLLQLDLSSAFDTTNMCTLLCLLRYTSGVSSQALNWVSSYSAHRSQSVWVGKMQSLNFSCKYGVPQGSLLGSLLFTLNISLISKVISSYRVNNMMTRNSTLHSMMLRPHLHCQSVSTLHNTGLILNVLSMNPDKTKAIMIGNNVRQFNKHTSTSTRPPDRQCQASDQCSKPRSSYQQHTVFRCTRRWK